MALCGFGGNDLIARTLSRAGWKISARTVARVREEKAPPALPAEGAHSTRRSVVARYPNHVWMADLTEIPGLFRIFSFKLGVVYDVFSRIPLAAGLFLSEPSSAQIARLWRKASFVHGTPRHFVSDQGTQFTARAFREMLTRLRVRQRFGAIGKPGSIALIERFWKTLKDLLGLRTLRPLVVGDLRSRLELALFYYAYLRPHQALGGATPAEVYLASSPAHLAAAHPPRGQPGEGPRASPFDIRFLDSEQRLPFLVAKAA